MLFYATLAFVNMTEYLSKVFEVTRIADNFTVYEDMDSAMQAAKVRRR